MWFMTSTSTVRTRRGSGRGLVAVRAVAEVLLESVLLKEVLDHLSNDADLARVAVVCAAWRADANALLGRRWDHGARAVLHGRGGAAAAGGQEEEAAFLQYWGHASVGQLGQVVVSRAGQARSCGQDWDGELCLGGAGNSRRRDCHFADALSPSLFKNLPEVEGGAAE